jgi:hypothetical protein
MNVTVEDGPAVGAFGVRAASESGHFLLKREAHRPANYQSLGDRNGELLHGVVGMDSDTRGHEAN